jgi:hypothetical protein
MFAAMDDELAAVFVDSEAVLLNALSAALIQSSLSCTAFLSIR